MKKRAIILTESGVTLTELIVVVAIVAILAVALGFSYQGWMGRYKMEKQIKGIYTDLMDARARAMGRDRNFLADFPTATSYRVAADDDGDNAVDPPPAGEVLPTFPKTLEYPMAGGGLIMFDSRGLVYTIAGGNAVLIDPPATPLVTLRLAAVGQPDYEPPDYDCIELTASRIKMGLWNNLPAPGVCNVK